MISPLYLRNIISINDLKREDLIAVLKVATILKKKPITNLLKNKVIASCFFEASTRTRLSFEAAIQKLGASIIGFSDSTNTSLEKKGETLADTISVISKYVDAIIIRHPKEGASRLATEFSKKIPIINAGDGSNQHPTQTLLDLFTIQETQKSLNNLHIAMIGDLKYGRTVHSLVQALSKFKNNHFYFISPKILSMPSDILLSIKESKNFYSVHHNMKNLLPKLDILYITRIQKERLDPSEYANVKNKFILRKNELIKVKSQMKILHPLPRADEINTDVDTTKHAYYFQQAENGIYTRQALLTLLLNQTLNLL